MFTGDHHIDVVAAAQTVIHHREQAVCIWWQVDADDFGFLVDHMINEARVLMREAVVILPPDMRGQQIIQRGDLCSPRYFAADLEPFGMLIEH